MSCTCVNREMLQDVNASELLACLSAVGILRFTLPEGSGVALTAAYRIPRKGRPPRDHLLSGKHKIVFFGQSTQQLRHSLPPMLP